MMSKEGKNRKIAEWLGYHKAFSWDTPDFFTDEEANAEVLEKMKLELSFHHESERWWICSGGHILARETDRKAAICEAALNLIEAHRAETGD